MQVCVQNLSALDFQLSHSQLVDVEESGAMQLLPLNTQAQQVRRRVAQSTLVFPLPPSRAHWPSPVSTTLDTLVASFLPHS